MLTSTSMAAIAASTLAAGAEAVPLQLDLITIPPKVVAAEVVGGGVGAGGEFISPAHTGTPTARARTIGANSLRKVSIVSPKQDVFDRLQLDGNVQPKCRASA
jgi:hypothetical protein